MTQLGKRLATSAVLVSLAIFTIFAAPLWLFTIVIELLVLTALYEYLSMAEKKGLAVNRAASLALGALMPIAFLLRLDLLAILAACLTLFIVNFKKEKLHQAFVSTSVSFLGVVYVAWFFSTLIYLRQIPQGAQWVFFAALVVKGGDAGAYFVGRKLGKAKLLEHVSPNKSVEGAWAGFLTSVILAMFSKTYIPSVDFHHFLFLGVLAGVISQLGDLAESLIKRDAGIKDSGTVPGLGGILDVLDSLLLTIPLVYFYLMRFVY
ncbi:MAG: phosphatidate cytidylyltransferase [Candidatus Omnitrophica bacterium]|nr:phosphatidate cytidylyltransferase [Candidatus Omnitrophota bacterium]